MNSRTISITIKYGKTTKNIQMAPNERVSALINQCEGRKIFFLSGTTEVPNNAMISSLLKNNKSNYLQFVAYNDEEIGSVLEILKASFRDIFIESTTATQKGRICNKRRISIDYLNKIKEQNYRIFTNTEVVCLKHTNSVPINPNTNKMISM